MPDDKKKSGAGRPTKYKSKFCTEIVEWFDVDHIIYDEIQILRKNGDTITRKIPKANQLPTFERYAVNIGVNTDTLVEWTKVYTKFSVAYKKCKALQKDMIIHLGAIGLYNASFTIFVAKNITDMRDVVIQKTEDEDEPLDLTQLSNEELDTFQQLVRKAAKPVTE